MISEVVECVLYIHQGSMRFINAERVLLPELVWLLALLQELV